MVGRLVHNKELRLGGKHLCQCHALDLSSGKFLHLLVRIGEIETGKELHDSVLILPEMFLIQIRCEFRAGSHDLLEDALLGIKWVFLFKKCDPDILQEHYLSARVGLVLSCKNPHQGCLACTIRSNESDFVALIDVETYFLEKDFRSVALRYVFNL